MKLLQNIITITETQNPEVKINGSTPIDNTAIANLDNLKNKNVEIQDKKIHKRQKKKKEEKKGKKIIVKENKKPQKNKSS